MLLLRKQRTELQRLKQAYHFQQRRNYVYRKQMLHGTYALLRKPQSQLACFALGFFKGYTSSSDDQPSNLSLTSVLLKLWQIHTSRQLAKDAAEEKVEDELDESVVAE